MFQGLLGMGFSCKTRWQQSYKGMRRGTKFRAEGRAAVGSGCRLRFALSARPTASQGEAESTTRTNNTVPEQTLRNQNTETDDIDSSLDCYLCAWTIPLPMCQVGHGYFHETFR